MTRGSCRAGSVNRVVSGATASQPTNESMRVEAACPTACQPCGANGVQLAACDEPAEPATAITTTASSRPTSSNWAVAEARSPRAASAMTASSSTAPTSALANLVRRR